MRALRARHSGVALQTRAVPIAKRVAGLRAGDFDVGLTRPPLVDDIDTEVVFTESVAALLPGTTRWSGRAELELAELADEPWVLTTRSSWPPWHRHFDAVFARAAFAPRVVQRRTSPQNLLALVAAGVGVTRLPLSRSLSGSGVVFVAVAGDVATSCSPGAPRPRRRRSSSSLGSCARWHGGSAGRGQGAVIARTAGLAAAAPRLAR